MMASLCPYRRFRLEGSSCNGKTFAELAAIYPLTEEDALGSFGSATQIMGIVNITDNSISDTGLFLEARRAAAHAERLFAEGASIIDLGAQATNPRVKDLGSVEQEWERLEPVLRLLAERWGLLNNALMYLSIHFVQRLFDELLKYFRFVGSMMFLEALWKWLIWRRSLGYGY